MPIPVIRHALDRTGVLPANLVSGEVHPLTTGENNIIVPKFGYFYKDSVTVTYVASNLPVPRAAYRFTEFFQEASLKYGKEICGSILFENKSLVGPVRINYQALGGDNSRSTGNLIEVFYDKLQDLPPVNWDDLLERPTQFKPKPDHQFNGNEIYDWGRVITHVDSIREAIITTNMPAYNALLVYIDRILAEIERLSMKYLDDHMQAVIDAFKAQFTKEYLGLDKLVNMACATDREGFLAGTQARKQTDITENKYMTLSALVSFKEGIYSGIVSRFETNLGSKSLKFTTPTRKAAFDIPNGGNASIIGVDIALNNSISYSQDLYPAGTIGRKFLTLQKISSGEAGRGGVYHNFDHSDDGMFFGFHPDSDVNKPFTWAKYITGDTLTVLGGVARQHFFDYGNPHEVTKEQILLGLVENLPVVTKEAIQKMQSEHTYLTSDMLMHFMRAFMLQNAWHVKLEDDNKNKFLLDNCQVVYSPCGSCGCDDRSDFQPPENNCPAANTEKRRYCGNGSNIEFPVGTEGPYNPYNVYGTYNLYVIYHDGVCGEYVETTIDAPICNPT